MRTAIVRPAADQVKARSRADRSSGTPLAKKLDIRPGMRVAMLGGFDRFEDLPGDLPENAALRNRFTEETLLGLYFVRSARELANAYDHAAMRLPKAASFWIIHPKQTKTLRTDFNQNDVREAGLKSGFVDYKVCSVDAEWSGLKFTRRKK